MKAFRSAGSVLLALIAVLVLADSAAAAPPPNDNFANAEVLSGLSDTTTGTTISSTLQAGETGNSADGHTVWFVWTAPSSGEITVDLSGSTFDTILQAYTGTTLPTVSQAAINDDFGGGPSSGGSSQSQITFNVTAGTPYRFRIDGFNGASGSYKLALYRPGTVTGQVLDHNGAAQLGYCVDALDAGKRLVARTTTGAGGTYTLQGIPAGNQRLFFHNCNDNTTINEAAEWFGDAASFALAPAINVSSGATVSNANAQLALGGQIDGSVTAQTGGAALENMCVTAFTPDGIQIDGVKTNVAGNYLLRSLPAGQLRVRFTNCANTDFAPEFYNDKPTLAAADGVAVTLGATTSGINAALATGGKIAGTVRDGSGAPIANACVSVYGADGKRVNGLATSAADGTYTYVGLATGSYRVEFSLCGGFSTAIEREWYDDEGDLERAKPVNVTAGSTVSSINAVLTAAGPDIDAPQTTISSGPAAGSTQGVATASFGLVSSEAGSTFQCKLDAAAFAACSSPKALAGLSDGAHTFSVRAIDTAGNVDSSPATRSFSVDVAACKQAQAALTQAQAAAAKAKAKVKKAKKKVKKAKRSGSASKIKQAKKKLKKAKKTLRAARTALAAAQAEVEKRC